jgi:uncharacterized membrane-anchored protein
MHPFTAVLGIIAGSLVSLAFGLAVVLLVFWMLKNDHPRFAAELPEVARGFVMFLWLAVFAACGFLGTVRARRWRYAPLALLWVGLILVGWYYWPS